MAFDQDFLWGVTTAAYQIEGSPLAAGGGASVWDVFCRRPGVIKDGSSGEIACDHYQRFHEDVALMRDIGIKHYRFSLSWPRILPEGIGRINETGLDFYDQLVDALLAAGIEPCITLFHWDFPYALYCQGGWLNSHSVQWFDEYVRIVVERLSDRVRRWITLNEPQVFLGLGLQTGEHAPGDRLGLTEMLLAGHHALLAHGTAVQRIRAHSKLPCEISFAPVGVIKTPATNTPSDVAAAREAMMRIDTPTYWNNTWWMDPVYLGAYPADGLQLFREYLPAISDRDMQTIHQPLDFLGVNIYHSQMVRASGKAFGEVVPHPPGTAYTMMDWPVTPEALYWGPRFFWERYHLPIIITENGISSIDWVGRDGQVHDPQRIDFTQRYLLELERAIQDGVSVKGYFHWTLIDNFEWAEGFKQRFGLVYLDVATQRRIPKDAAYWYRDVIRSHGAHLHAEL